MSSTRCRRVGNPDLASTIGVQLDDVQTALRSRGFSLGAVEVNNKVLCQEQGNRIETPGEDHPARFRPDNPTPEVAGQTVPDLMFLKENRARAVLARLGLLLEASTGPAALNPRSAAGQAMLQTPEPGVPLPRGGRVHLVFAAEKE